MTGEWSRNGDEEVGRYLKNLQAYDLPQDYLSMAYEFQDNIEDEKFTLQDYLKVKEIEAKLLLAKAIFDLPEYMIDQFGKFANDGYTPVIRAEVDVNGSIDTTVTEG